MAVHIIPGTESRRVQNQDGCAREFYAVILNAVKDPCILPLSVLRTIKR